jgi:hypothetical protein
METLTYVSCEAQVDSKTKTRTLTIRCYLYLPLTATAQPLYLSPDRELTAEAMTLLMQVDNRLLEARADWNEDRLRRLMRLRPKCVCRLRRRWDRLNPKPRIPLGTLRRRYHANLAGYLYGQNS